MIDLPPESHPCDTVRAPLQAQIATLEAQLQVQAATIARLEILTRQHAAIVEVIEAINDAPDLTAAFIAALQGMTTALDGEGAALYDADVTDGSLNLRLMWRNYPAGMSDTPALAREVVAAGVPLYVSAAGSGLLIAPLVARQQSLGIVALTCPNPDPTFAALLTERCALALHRQKLVFEAQQQAKRQQALATVVQAVTGATDLATALSTVLHSLVETLGCTRGAIYRYSLSEAEMHLLAYVNYPQGAPKAHLHLSDYPQALTSIMVQQPRIVKRQTTDSVSADFMRRRDLDTALVVPIAVAGEILGIAFAIYTDPAIQPTPEDVAFAQAMVASCAEALNRARLTAELAAERERLEAVIAAAPVAILVTGPDQRIRLCNAAANALHDGDIKGLSLEERWARQPYVVVSEAGQPTPLPQTITMQTLAGEDIPPRRCTFAYHDGRRKSIQVAARRIPDTSEVVTVYQDVTVITDLARQAQEQARRQHALATAVSAVTQATNQPTALTTVLHTLITALNSSCGSIYRYNPAEAALELLTHVNYRNVPPLSRIQIDDFPVTRQALLTQEPYFVTPETTNQRAADLSRARAVSGTLIVPFAAAGRVLGLAYVNYSDPATHPTAEDKAFAQAMAAHCAQAMEQTRLTADLAAERARLETAIEAAPVCITVGDVTGHVELMNAMARDLFRGIRPGFSPQPEYPDVPFTLLDEEDRTIPLNTFLQEVIANNSPLDSTLMRLKYHDDSRVRDCLANFRRTPDGFSIIGIFQDITDVRQTMRDRLTAQAEIAALKSANALKTRFIRVVSHELRTPLTGIMGFAELLELREVDRATVKEYAAKIVLSAERMQAMLRDYLDLERLEAGVEEFICTAVDAGAVVAAASAVVSPAQHPVSIEPVAVPPVWADESKLRRVLENLLTNAAKYSAQGQPIRISADVAPDSVTIAVIDKGPGIPPEAQPHIFETFYRVKSADPLHNQPGTGLGLAICQELMTRMGGQIGFTSAPTGTTFWIRLPRADGRVPQ